MATVKRPCLRCDFKLDEVDGKRPERCGRCGSTSWDEEFDLAQYIGERNDYFVAGEASSSPDRILWLELEGTWNASNRPRVPLSHRLKNSYRKLRDDLRGDTRPIIVSFGRAPGGVGPEEWNFSTFRTASEAEVRRRANLKCGRHLWGWRLFQGTPDINAAAQRMACNCPPGCAVCALAEAYSIERVRPGGDGGASLYGELEAAVKRDLGLWT